MQRISSLTLLIFIAQFGLSQTNPWSLPEATLPLHYFQSAMHSDQRSVSDSEKALESTHCLQGEVVSIRTENEFPHLRTWFHLKSSEGDTLAYFVEGGATPDWGIFRTDQLYLPLASKGEFCLKSTADGWWTPAYGAASFTPAARPLTMGLQRVDVNLANDWRNGNAGEFLTITGTGFGDSPGYVTFFNGSEWYAANTAENFNYVAWQDDEIQVEVPAAFSHPVRVVTATGETLESTDTLHIGYNLSSAPGSPYGYTHLVGQTDGGILFQVNEALFNIPDRMEAIDRTFTEFICKTGANIQLGDAATGAGWNLGDGVNSISFDDAENPLWAGTVGYCNTLWFSCILGNETFYYVGEMDVVINDDFDFDYSTGMPEPGQAKFSYVLMHEMGHALRLGHVNELGETMYPSVTDMPSNAWHARDTISAMDEAGASHAVEIASSFTFSACGVQNMIPVELDCPQTTVEVTNMSNDLPVHAYPNPFQEQLVLPPGHWKVYNAMGRLMYDGMNAQVDASNWTGGMYFLVNEKGQKQCLLKFP